MHGGIHRSLRTISIMALVVGGIFLILISPMGLRLISTAKGINWARLSSIGQTYGAISAVISGVALAGIAVSLFLQARELDLTREQMFQTYHLDLVRFSIENPSFISSWGYVPTEGSSLDDVRRVGYTNMIVSFWSTSYVTRRLDESELQLNFAQMFKGEVGRNYWKARGMSGMNRLGTVAERSSSTLQTRNIIRRLRLGRPWSPQIHGQIRRVIRSLGLRRGQAAIAEQKLLLVSLRESSSVPRCVFCGN
jgi:Family of unknown function (DUF6082)